MAPILLVEKEEGGNFRVTVEEGRGQSSHPVTVSHDYYGKLTAGKVSVEELVRKSFEFLLERELKQSILKQFDLQRLGSGESAARCRRVAFALQERSICQSGPQELAYS